MRFSTKGFRCVTLQRLKGVRPFVKGRKDPILCASAIFPFLVEASSIVLIPVSIEVKKL